MSNVRSLFGGKSPDEVLEIVRSQRPRALLVSFIDGDGLQKTIVSDVDAPELAFLVMSTQSQVSKLFSSEG